MGGAGAQEPGPRAREGYLTESNWNILCPGPSILQCRDFDLLEPAKGEIKAPTVAVNRAIKTALARHGAHIWAMWDKPDLLWDECKLAAGYHQRVWIGPQDQNRWEELLPPMWSYRVLSKGMVAHSDGTLRPPYTLMYVIEKIVSLGGKKIRVLGADMKGTWRKDLENWEEDDTEDRGLDSGWDRWAYEREHWDRMVEVATEKGVSLSRYFPKPSVTAAQS